MSVSLIWKSVVFWIVVLVLLVFATTLIPGSDKWPEWVPFVIIVAIASAQIWYIKGKQRANPEIYKLSAPARRNAWILLIVVFSAEGFQRYFVEHGAWHIWQAAGCALVVIGGVYRLVQEFRRGRTDAA